MGSVAYDVSNPLVQLRMCAASSFFGEPVYYSETESKRSTSNASRFIDVLTETLGASGKMARWSKLGAAERMEQAIDELQEEAAHDAQLDSTEERGGVR